MVREPQSIWSLAPEPPPKKRWIRCISLCKLTPHHLLCRFKSSLTQCTDKWHLPTSCCNLPYQMLQSTQFQKIQEGTQGTVENVNLCHWKRRHVAATRERFSGWITVLWSLKEAKHGACFGTLHIPTPHRWQAHWNKGHSADNTWVCPNANYICSNWFGWTNTINPNRYFQMNISALAKTPRS